MHGSVLGELKRFGTAALPEGGWARVCEAAGLPEQLFLPVSVYPDSDALLLIAALADALQTESASLLEDFGDHLAEALLQNYRSLIPREWGGLDVLENVEGTIHRVVRLQDPKMEPPHLVSERSKETEVSITYTSPKKLCHLAIGLVRGVARVYAEDVEIEQTECMHTGSDRCLISVVQR